MDWMNQAQEMFKTWTDMQQKMWNGMMDTLKGVLPMDPTNWLKNVQAWEDSVKSTLLAQAEWTRTWARNVTAATGVSGDLSGWARQVQDMVAFWIEMQEKLWDNFFAMLKKMDAAKAMGVPLDVEKAVQTWQDNFHKMLEAQQEWVKSWTPGEQDEQE